MLFPYQKTTYSHRSNFDPFWRKIMHTILPRLRPCLGVWFLFCTLLVLTASSAQRVAASVAAGQMTYHVDPSFSLSVERAGGWTHVVAKTPDGGFLVGGEFSNFYGPPRLCLAKIHADGTLDPTFNAQRGFTSTIDSTATGARVMSLLVQPDGRIVVGGHFSAFNGAARNGIARLNTDGSLDASFQPGTGFSLGNGGSESPTEVFALAQQADGRIIAGGNFTSYNSTSRNHIVRLNTDGSLDASFDPGTGFSDWSYPGGAITVQNDGRILAGGNFTSYNDVVRNRIARLNTDGTLDGTFDPGAGFSGALTSLVIQPDGHVLAGGHFGSYRGASRSGIARLNSDASLDTTFAPSGGAAVNALTLQADGHIIVGGEFTYFNTVASRNIARLNTDGSLDTFFSPGAGFATDNQYASQISSLALQADGRIVACGNFCSYDGQTAYSFVRLNSNGTLDRTTTSPIRRPANIAAIAPLADGKWAVGGNFVDVNGVACGGIALLNKDGSLDTSFNTGTGFELPGYSTTGVSAIAAQADGRLLVCGSFTLFNGQTQNGVVRLKTDGSLDSSFSLSGILMPGGFYTVAVQPSGQIVLGGSFIYFNNSPYTFHDIVRLTPTGAIDPVFKPGGTFATYSGGGGGVGSMGYYSWVSSIALQTDGRILVGQQYHNAPSSGSSIVRLNTDGSVDTGFQGASASNPFGTGSNNFTFATQPDGHVIAAGTFETMGSVACNGLARLNIDGTLDSVFTSSGSFNRTITSITVLPDGRPVFGGKFSKFAATPCPSVVGFNALGGLDPAFNIADPIIDSVYLMSRGDDNRLLLAGPSAAAGGALKADFVLLRADAAPAFTLQPQGGVFTGGTNVTLTAKATGYPDVAYQWMKDGSALAGQTNTSLLLTNVTVSVAGTYTVVATNTHGSMTSTPAMVGVAEHVTADPNNTDKKKGGGGAIGPWMLVALAGATVLRFRKRA